MARHVILTDYCDVCLYRDEREVKAQFTGDVVLSGLRRNIAFCPEHQAEFLDPLGRIITDYGRVADADASPVRGRPRAKTLENCPICLKPCDSRSALSSHVRRTHKKSIEDVEQDQDRLIAWYQCPHCDAAFTGTQKLGAHVKNRHS